MTHQHLRSRRPPLADAAIGRRTVLRTTSTTYTLTGQPRPRPTPMAMSRAMPMTSVDRLSSVDRCPSGAHQLTATTRMSRPTSVLNPAIQAQPLLQQRLYAGRADREPDRSPQQHHVQHTSFAYDGLDRLSTTTYPDSSTETLAYDADSNVLSATDARGPDDHAYLRHAEPARAPRRRLSEADVTYGYDLAGRLIGASDTSAAIGCRRRPPAQLCYRQHRPTTSSTGPDRHVRSGARRRRRPRGQRRLHPCLRPGQPALGQTATDNSWWSYPDATAIDGRLHREQPQPVYRGRRRDADL